MPQPNHPRGRLIYAALFAMVAFSWQYVLFKPNALIFAPFLATPLVPLFDRLLPAVRFQCRRGAPGAQVRQRDPA